MELLLYLVAVAFLLVVVLALLRPGRSVGGDDWPLYAKKPLTQPEQVLYHRMVKALPDCIVLAQVQASRVLGVKRGFNFGEWNNRINRLSLDFVVCLKDATVVAAVELDDSTHGRSDRREADDRKERALKAAGVPLVRWSVSAMPDERGICAAFASESRGKFDSDTS